MSRRTLIWFRGKHLRLADHPALRAALEADEVVPLFVVDPHFFAPERAQRYANRARFLVQSLRALSEAIAARGSRLLIVRGRSVEVLPALVDALACDRVVAQSWVAPVGRARDRRVAGALAVPFDLFASETLTAPGSLRSGQGRPYAVCTPFARAFRARVRVDEPLPAPRTLPPLPAGLERLGRDPLPSLDELGIAPRPELPEGGEPAARARLRSFLKSRAEGYPEDRERLDRETSGLSADLKFGTLSPRMVWRAAAKRLGDGPAFETFSRELLWREFAHSTLWDRPELLEEPFQSRFVDFPWREGESDWRAFAEGRTGYPVVDAAARQLLARGFVHNRARMIAASFLTKHLRIHYQRGEAHYLAHLIDGDWAQNNAGWQWSAGCGCDAQPYFRVFNPITQGRRFDPEGAYVRRWVPELAELPTRSLHAPWEAPALTLEAAGVRLGETYPLPMVDHREAREEYLRVARRHLRGEP